MIKLYIYRMITTILLIMIFIVKRFKDSDTENGYWAKKMVDYNNDFVLNRFKTKKIKAENILILLPHCIQDNDCNIKITSNVDNCIRCKKCNIYNLLLLKDKYGIDLKVATGGTLARKYIKEKRPKVVIAVACERDLVTGIYDSFPLAVLGFFNIRDNGPCYNTHIDCNEIEKYILKILVREETK